MAHFGPVPGHPPGSWYEDRRALAAAGVHRPLRAGICGRADEGAESVVLSGGYVDTEDFGDVILYTGSGGRDPRTGRQVRNQPLTRTNQALVTSMRRGLPVRVVRGARAASRYAPDEGYRYDGLYRVTHFWPETGEDGHRVWRFRLESISKQPRGP
jgi:putative restriction endonuclease